MSFYFFFRTTLHVILTILLARISLSQHIRAIFLQITVKLLALTIVSQHIRAKLYIPTAHKAPSPYGEGASFVSLRYVIFLHQSYLLAIAACAAASLAIGTRNGLQDT